MTSRRYNLALLLIVAVGMLGRLFHFNLATNSDEQHYVVAARELLQPVPIPIRYMYTTRMIWIWTLNLWGRLWEPNLEWTSVLMFLFAAASILLVGMIAKRVFGAAAALVAAAITATYYISLRYDVMTAPDSMAVPVTLLSTWFFLNFLDSGGLRRLVVAGVLMGTLIGIKDYYALIAFPFAFCLLLRPPPAPPLRQEAWTRLRQVAILAVSSMASASFVLLLNYFAHGDLLWQFHGFHYVMRDAEGSGSGGLASLVALVGGRFKYVYYLFGEHGVVGGVVLLAGAVYLAALAKKRLDCRLLVIIPILFLLFLSLAFLSVHPLEFLPQKPRYIFVMCPFLAIGAGGAVAATWERLKDDAVLRRCFGVILAATAVLNLWLPNYRNVVVPMGTTLRACIAKTKATSGAYLVLPWYYRWSAPDGPTLRGVEVRYSLPSPDYGERVDRAAPHDRFDYSYGDIDSILADKRPAIVYVPDDMGDDPAVMALKTAGFRKIDLIGSTSSVRTWLEFFGLGEGDTSCGWLYVRK